MVELFLLWKRTMTKKTWLGLVVSALIILSCNLFSGSDGAKKDLAAFRPEADISLDSGAHQF
jgi:hypothetical protein